MLVPTGVYAQSIIARDISLFVDTAIFEGLLFAGFRKVVVLHKIIARVVWRIDVDHLYFTVVGFV